MGKVAGGALSRHGYWTQAALRLQNSGICPLLPQRRSIIKAVRSDAVYLKTQEILARGPKA